MERDSRKGVGEEGFEWGPDTIEAEIRDRIRGMIEAIVEEELAATLGAAKSQRVGAVRTGYRHGARERQIRRAHRGQALFTSATLDILKGTHRRVSLVQIQFAPAARPVFAPLSRAPSEIPAFTESGHPRSVPAR
jgi:hypothetical protein